MAEPVLLINLAGNVEMADPAEAGSLIAAGYVPASPEQARDWALEQKYGTQPVRAGLESFGSMLTFGLSDVMARQMGVPAEDLAGREKANPTASLVGSAAGVVLPAIMTAGVSAEAQGLAGAARVGAELAAPSLIAKAGRAAAKGAAKLLPEAETMIGRLARKGAAGAAGGAVEGALFEVGHLVHEAALEDPGLTAESALAQVGLSAALMGGLAGTGSVLGALTKEIGGRPSDLAGKVADWLADTEAAANLKQAGGIQSTRKALLKRVGGNEEYLNKKLVEMRDMGILDDFARPARVLERAEAIQASDGPAIREFLLSADHLAAAEGRLLGNGIRAVERARSEILEPLARNPLTSELRDVAGGLGRTLDRYAARWAKGSSLEDLHLVRRELDESIRGINREMAPNRTDMTSALNRFRRFVSEELEAGVAKSGQESALWKQMNRRYEVASTAADLASAGLSRELGNNRIPLTESLGLLGGILQGDPLVGLAVAGGTSLARKYGSATIGWMARGLRDVVTGEAGQAVVNRTARQIAQERAAGAATGVAIAQARGVSAPETRAALSVLEEAKRRVTQEMDSGIKSVLRETPATARRVAVTAATHARHLEQMGRMVVDVGSLSSALAGQALDTTEHAPTVAQAMQLSSARAAAYLSAKMPPRPARTLLGPSWRPTKAEQRTLERTFQVVDRPLTVLRMAREGTLTPGHVEALKAAWPSLYTHLQGRILSALVDRGGGQLPYRSRMMLSMLMGQDIDGTMLGKAILANQAVYAQATQRPSMTPPATGGKPEKLNLGARSATPGQAADARRAEVK